MRALKVDLLDELPNLAPPADLVAEVEYLALQELEVSTEGTRSEKAWSPRKVVRVPLYENAVHVTLVVAYALCAAQAGFRMLQRLIAG